MRFLTAFSIFVHLFMQAIGYAAIVDSLTLPVDRSANGASNLILSSRLSIPTMLFVLSFEIYS